MYHNTLPPRHFRSSPGQWLREILAVVVSITALAGLAFFLAAFDGKLIFSWHGITLNTIVSTLSTFSKAALMLAVAESTSQWKWILYARHERRLIDFELIDRASRGLRGSWAMLWMRNSSFALRLGAAATFLAVFVDPFAQQLVQFRQSMEWSAIQDANQTMIPRAERYSQGNEYWLQSAGFNGRPSRTNNQKLTFVAADFSMQSSILFGLTHPLLAVQQQIPVSCPSSNCTWPPFESLAVCSTCNRLESKLERYKTGGDLYVELESDNPGAMIGNGTGFVLPNGLIIDNLDGDQQLVFGEVLMTAFGTANASQTNTMQDLDTLIWATSFIKSGRANPNDTAGARWPDLPLSAVECAMFYCVNTYESAVVNGVLAENVTRVESAARNPLSWQPLSNMEYNLSIFTRDELDSLAFGQFKSFVRHTDLQLTSPSGGAFNISQATVDSISSYFQSTFAAAPIDYNYSDSRPHARLNGFYVVAGQPQYSPSEMQAFYDAADVEDLFVALAASMSNAVRAGADGGPGAPGGRVGAVGTYYRVEWPWIALQGTVALAGVLMLLATVWASSKPEVPMWKSSALAVLSRGPWVFEGLKGAAEVKEMRKEARENVVRLM